MDTTLTRMEQLLRDWEPRNDRRCIFLGCYARMTRNMIAGVRERRFQDPVWVGTLLRRFADYYFDALEAYEGNHPQTPAVWRCAYEQAADAETSAVANLLLGVNAHINHDLVLVTAELLAPEWADRTPERLARRFADYDLVNEIIAHTIDEVQDEVLERHSALMEVIDVVCGRLDEWCTSRLITSWRGDVWEQALELVELTDPEAASAFRRTLDRSSTERAQFLLRGDEIGVRAFGYPLRVFRDLVPVQMPLA